MRRQLGRDITADDLTRGHVLNIFFVNEKLRVRERITPYASNVTRSVGNVETCGPLSAIKGTDELTLRQTAVSYCETSRVPKLVLESNFMAVRVVRIQKLPPGSIVGNGFYFPPQTLQPVSIHCDLRKRLDS